MSVETGDLSRGFTLYNQRFGAIVEVKGTGMSSQDLNFPFLLPFFPHKPSELITRGSVRTLKTPSLFCFVVVLLVFYFF